MARTVQDAKVGSREARRKLKARGKPYWKSLDNGLHVGYRKGLAGGVWVFRRYLGDQTYETETIAASDDHQEADGAFVLDFAQAQAKVRELAERRRREGAGLPTEAGPYTVARCLEEYLSWMDHSRKSARDARYRAERIIIPALGAVVCDKLTKGAIEKWLRDEAHAPARLRTKNGAEQNVKPPSDDPDAQRKRRASTNRCLTILKAALNRAWREGRIASDAAWRKVKPFAEADVARVRYLTIAEAQRLINASGPDFRLLVRAALATGCRYSELAGLRVADFNPDAGTVHVRTSKTGHGRHVVLADEGVALFAAQAAGRPANALLLPKDDGGVWGAGHQARPMRLACRAARIEPAVNFHALRHTFASHAIMNGAPLLVIAKNLGHSDTKMVEKHYGHLSPSFAADAIRAAAPRFGVETGKVRTFASG